jgi:hypothetical protein
VKAHIKANAKPMKEDEYYWRNPEHDEDEEEEEEKEKEEEEEEEEDEFDWKNPWGNPEYKTYLWDHKLWDYQFQSGDDEWNTIHGLILARHSNVSEEELAAELPRFLLGHVEPITPAVYWASVRQDVATVREDLKEAQPEEGNVTWSS